MTNTRMTKGWASAGSGVRLLMLAAGLLLPLGLHAQTDPVANPNPNPNPVPNNPQTVPGTNGSQATPGVQRSATPYDSSNAGVASDDLSKALTQTVPARMAEDRRCAACMFSVQTAAARP